MAYMMNCNNKGCGKYTAPLLDQRDNQVYCAECGGIITNANHFIKVQLKTLAQIKRPAKSAYSVRCTKCKQEALPKLSDNGKDLICAYCGIGCQNISKPFELLIRTAIAKGEQDL